jgi:protein-L-isoaspartate(D-aspartate) O-methyltransferase
MVAELERLGVSSRALLDALAGVPRHLFIPEAFDARAYAVDVALPIGLGQTISQPLTVARMTEALALRGDERVLEVGTGSGYQAAVLSALCREVVSIERHEALANRARQALRSLGCTNVSVLLADGSAGWPEGAPYDAILVTAGASKVPAALIEQLRDGGRLVIPVGTPEQQTIVCIERRGHERHETVIASARFVALVGSET